jgi:hypothetical protein
MPFRRLRFVVLLLAALTLTMEAAHVLALPQKMRYGPELYASVNSTIELLGLASLFWSVLAGGEAPRSR